MKLDDIPNPAAPSRLGLVREIRTLGNLASVPLALANASLSRPVARDPLVITAPGFMFGDGCMAPLRRYLKLLGYETEGWGLGVNKAGLNFPHGPEQLSERWPIEWRDDYNGEASVPCLCDRFAERVAARAAATGRPVVLIGWSLGGYVCREVARDLPDTVVGVITLGAPVVGGPRYTLVAEKFSSIGMDLEWIEREISKREVVPIRQPVLALYSRSDGVVGWSACVDRHSPNVTHVDIGGSHSGLAFNRRAWRRIRDNLESIPVGTRDAADAKGAGTVRIY